MLGKECPMKLDAWSCTTRRAAWGLLALFAFSGLVGCGANGKLFGRKEPEPPATISEFLSLPRPE
jgi:hypothetical protein